MKHHKLNREPEASKIVSLEAENIMLKNCNEQLNTMLDAWYSAFGTNQITHALARIESAEKRAAKSP